jgi:hypothetical protein
MLFFACFLYKGYKKVHWAKPESKAYKYFNVKCIRCSIC